MLRMCLVFRAGSLNNSGVKAEFMGKTVEDLWFYRRYKTGQRRISKNRMAATDVLLIKRWGLGTKMSRTRLF